MMARIKYLSIIVLAICSLSVSASGKGDPPKQNTAGGAYPQFPDLVYEYHIAELNKATPLDLTYNQHVRRYIDIFTLERRPQVEQFLSLSEWYFPVFEEYLARYDLPLELKYLAVVESGLNPLARSSSGATGLWQFLYHSAQMFDLQITSYIDERSDVYKSTDAACRYLRYLHQTFGNWNLALAAYNGGPGELEKAIARSGGKREFWDLYPYITEAMRNYVPAFIAISYVLNNADKHRLASAPVSWRFHDLDTLQVRHRIGFSGISRKIGLDEHTIRQLNPCYRMGEIPDTGKPMTLVLPKEKTRAFLESENLILSAEKNGNTVPPEKQEGMTSFSYAVQKGDYLHKIAIRYGCTIDDIRRWNSLPGKNLSPGMKLIIWTKK